MERARALSPMDAQFLLSLGSLRLQQGATGEAYGFLREAGERDRHCVVAAVTALVRSGRPLEQVTPAVPRTPGAFIRLARQLGQAGRKEESGKALVLAARLTGTQLPRTCLWLAEALARSGRFGEGERLLLMARQRQPELSDAWEDVARFYGSQRRTVEQARAYGAALERFPRDPRLTWGYAEALMQNGHNARAAELVTGWLDSPGTPDTTWHARMRLALARIRRAQGNTDEAASEALAAARGSGHRDAGFVLAVSALLAEMRRHADAVSVLHGALKASPRDARLQHALGLQCMATQDVLGAVGHLADAVRLAPENARYREDLERARRELAVLETIRDGGRKQQ
jgi:predicted Zn-dependent protease